MIIRNRPTKTLKASPLNSRGCVVPPECPVTWNMHTESVPHQYRWGDPVRVDVTAAILSAGPSDAAAIEGRPRCGLTGGIIADNHLILLLTFFSLNPHPSSIRLQMPLTCPLGIPFVYTKIRTLPITSKSFLTFSLPSSFRSV